MTKAQRTLYALLAEQNNAAKNAGEPYLHGERKTIQEIAESVSDEDAEAMSEELRNGAGWTEDPEGRGRMDFILWDLYILRRGIPWEEMQRALLDIFQQTTPFYKVAQSQITNALTELFVTPMQMDLEGKASGQVGNRKGTQIFFELENAADHELGVTAGKLLDAFLKDFAENAGRPLARIPLKQYAEMVKEKTTKGALDSLRRQVVADLYTLGDIKARYYAWNNGRKELTGFIRLNGGTAMIENGVILWNWNADLIPSLKKLDYIDYSRETFTTNPRTNQYYYSRYIDLNFRRNEAKSTVTKIHIKTLLYKGKNPDIEKLRAQRASIRNRLIIPFFRDLDALERVFYDVYTQDGTLVDDPYQMTAEEFLNGYIVVDYSDYETHPERTKKRDKKKRQAAERKTKNKEIKALEERIKALEDEQKKAT